MAFLKYIKSWDFLGQKLTFKIDKAGNHKTYYGGFVSISYYLFLTYFIFDLGVSMFITRTPSGLENITPGKEEEHQFLNITDSSFLIGFAIEDSYSKQIDTSDYLFATFIHKYLNTTSGEEKITRLKSIPCNKIISKELDPNPEKYSNFICPDTSDIREKYLFGDYTTEEASMIEIIYSLCNHDKNNPQCKDPNKLKEAFSKKNHWITTLVSKVDYFIKNVANPLQVKIVKKYNILSPYKVSYSKFYLNKYFVKSYDGIFSETINKHESTGINEDQNYDDITLNTPDIEKFRNSENLEDTSISKGFFFYQNNIHTYSRRYKTLFDFVAGVVGVIRILTITIGL